MTRDVDNTQDVLDSRGALMTTTKAKLAHATTHTLKLLSSHDVSATCTCGKWHYTTLGPLTQEIQIRMEEEFQRHQLQYWEGERP